MNPPAPPRRLKLWSLLVHVVAVGTGLAFGIASYHWLTGS
jgi:hypothetical protein